MVMAIGILAEIFCLLTAIDQPTAVIVHRTGNTSSFTNRNLRMLGTDDGNDADGS